ncbi:MAG: hypothetical protein ACM3OO_08140 [Planctomycetaceae bacterium]|jgi:hypothetical protein
MGRRREGVRGPVRALARFFTASTRAPERDPDVREPFESLDDWILFGPRPR